MHELGIERLCVFGMPPAEFARLTCDLGCTGIGIGLTPMRRYNPHGYADWSLRDDPNLRRDLLAVMQDNGLRISLLEGFGVAPGRDVRDQSVDLDLLCELGGDRINAASIDKDESRTFDQFAVLCEMAMQRDIKVSIEIGPGPVATLGAAMRAARHVALPNFSFLIDTMHYFRFGSTVEELAAIDPALIGYVQLCDAPLVSPFPSYLDEAMHERMVPGEGELPLQQMLDLVPDSVTVSVEIPRRSLAEQGMGPLERIAPCITAMKSMLGAP